MSVPLHPEATEVGDIPAKGPRTEHATRDLSNPGEIYLLACSAAKASDRQLMRISLAELRALAGFAVWSGGVAARFGRALELSDADAPPEQLISALKEAAEEAGNMN